MRRVCLCTGLSLSKYTSAELLQDMTGFLQSDEGTLVVEIGKEPTISQIRPLEAYWKGRNCSDSDNQQWVDHG